MGEIIGIINQKGGVGKSTTVEAMSVGLAQRGYKVLGVDLDAQANLTFSYGARTECDNTVLEVLMGEARVSEAIQHTKNGDIVAGNRGLSGADGFIVGEGKERRLRKALEEVKERYDYIIIDTPPALGILTINTLTASKGVIIPAQADIYSLKGVEQLAQTIEAVHKYSNRELSIEGILLTRYNARCVLSREVSEIAEQLAKKIGTKLFKTTIREAIAVKEAQISQESLYKYAPKGKVTGDYTNFIKEFLKEE